MTAHRDSASPARVRRPAAGRAMPGPRASLVVLLLIPLAGLAAPRYTLTVLGVLDGESDFVFPKDINVSAQVVGNADTRIGDRAYFWDPERGMGDLGSLPGGMPNGAAHGINDRGHVVGGSRFHSIFSPDHAFLWKPDGGFTDLGDLHDGRSFSRARAINGDGQVVGTSATGGPYQAFLWEPSGGMRNLGARIHPAGDSHAHDINASGRVAGYAVREDGAEGFLWGAEEGAVWLGRPDGGGSYAFAVNDRGQVVGRRDGPSGHEAFLWEASRGMRGLGFLDRRVAFSEARDINNRGVVVGRGTGSAGMRAFRWSGEEGMQALQDLIEPREEHEDVVLYGAEAINDRGEIIAYGRIGERPNARAFLLVPRRPQSGLP